MRRFEKFLLVLLLIINVSLFSYWGYQSVVYSLGKAFNVRTDATALDTVIGIVALISSALVIAGAALQWAQKPSARLFFLYGPAGFLVKNLFDVWNEIIAFRASHASIAAADIQSLAETIGAEIFQVAFWMFVLIYFYLKLRRQNIPVQS